MPDGQKFDKGKIRYELIPQTVPMALAWVLTDGCKEGGKYDERNWENGLPWGKCFGALQRHLAKWWGNVPYDKESGKSHLWHALCELAFLVHYEMTQTGTDDRPDYRMTEEEVALIDGEDTRIKFLNDYWDRINEYYGTPEGSD